VTWILVNGGQTGVDRGALLAARALGMEVTGALPSGWQTEEGPLPEELRDGLQAPEHGTYASRTRLNIHLADVVVLIVPNILRPGATPGTLLTAQLAFELKRPCLVDDGQDPAFIRKWLRQAVALRRIYGVGPDPKVLVAGPRASRWSAGEARAKALVGELFANVARVAVARQLELPL
jgi:hypothetical protein